MRTWALDLLRCPKSGSPLKLQNPRFEEEHVMEGALVTEEGIAYPIHRGVPRLVLDFQSRNEERTAESFGDEWQLFNKSDGYAGSEELFFDFVRGLSPIDFKDKTVLDAGCGNGRWDKIISNLGAKRIIALDISKSVDYCFANTRDRENVVVVQGSIYDPPCPKGKFDLVLSIGVICFLPDPKRGLGSLKGLLHEDGRLAFWVYALEGNELYLKLARPLRSITKLIPPKPLLAISHLLTAPVWIYAHTVNKKFGHKKNGSERLPMAHYVSTLLKYRYRGVLNIIYDQLTPDIAYYISKQELLKWLEDLKLEVADFSFRNNNSYSVVVKSIDGVPAD